MTREIAYKIWKRYLKKGIFLSRLIEKELQKFSLDRRERAFLFELLYGACRQKAFIENILKHYIKRKKTSSYSLIFLGTYQIFFMRSVTDYAAVNETVKIAKKTGLSRESGFISEYLLFIYSYFFGSSSNAV